eukprot:m.119502 g.119502  ORF g.119502 m.119502 type:complete len:140 (+) comp9558_c0_seq1:834-1253(+)
MRLLCSRHLRQPHKSSPYVAKSIRQDSFTLVERTVTASLRHMFVELCKLVAHDTARKVVCFPVAVRTSCEGEPPSLIFPNLAHDAVPFQVGLPQGDLFRKYVLAAAAAIDACHAAAVVHLDLYAPTSCGALSAMMLRSS